MFSNWVMTSINGGTTFDYDSSYFAGVRFFQDTPSVDDAVYISCAVDTLFNGFKPWILTPFDGTPVLAFEYWNGSAWTAVSGLSDGSSNFTVSGYPEITWTLPSDWAKTTVNGKNYYWFRIRITDVTGITIGAVQGFDYPKFKYNVIYVDSSDSITPASLLASDVAGGWGVVSLTDNIYKFTVPIFFKNSCGATFTSNYSDLQFGITTRPIAMEFGEESVKLIINKGTPSLGESSSFIKFFSIPMDIRFNGSIDSEIYNLTVQQNTGIRFAPYARGKFYNCTFLNCLPYQDGNYERVNFITMAYMLTTPKGTYKNCYFKSNYAISIDPRYNPAPEDSIFDIPAGESPTSIAICMPYPNPGWVEYINCSFLNGNKYIYGVNFTSVTGNQNNRAIHSNRFDLTVLDNEGVAIENAIVTLTDVYGNPAMLETVTGNPYPNAAYSMTDTSITVTDSTNLVTGEYYWILGES